MRSSFFEFNVAISGLTAARAALDSVSHNVSNASTPGYSRQYVEQRAYKPLYFADGRGMIGTGVDVYGVGQIRSFYLDKKFWSENSVLGEFEQKSVLSNTVQTILNEPSDTSFTSSMNEFFDRIQDLQTNAGDITFRTNLVQTSQTFAKYFSTAAASLQRTQRDINQEIKTTVDQINSIGTQIYALNKQISFSELDGSKANDLRDQRALLVDELSKIVNVTVLETEMNEDYAAGKYFEPEDRGKSIKQFVVQIDGNDFVNGFFLSPLECRERTIRNNPEDAEGLYDIFWSNTNTQFNQESRTLSGELKGLLDTRDGNNQKSFTATIQSVEASEGGVTIVMEGISRDDLHSSGNITIGDTTYAYDQFELSYPNAPEDMTPIATITIPPPHGKMTIGDVNVAYSDLQIESDSITFKIDPNHYPIDAKPIMNITLIRVGNMMLDGNVTYNRETGEVTISNSKLGEKLGAIEEEATVSVAKSLEYKGLPYYINRLNEFVRTFAQAVNEGQSRNNTSKPLHNISGFNQGINLYGEKGANLFHVEKLSGEFEDEETGESYEIPLYSKITAATFTVNNDLFLDPRLLGVAKSPNPDVSDNTIAHDIADLKHLNSLFYEGEVGNFIQAIVGEAGVDARHAINFQENYKDIVTAINNQRLSVSGVSLDEEVANMVRFQQAYNASAKLVSIIDAIYETTINRMGSW